jgi:C-terminal processing protease CtpA/Prc
VLIIDVRENGGGEDSATTALLRHITEKPFRLSASTQVKRSQEVRDFVNSLIRIPFRWMRLHYLSSEARQYFNGEPGTLAPLVERPVRTWPRADPFYAGPVCVLTGPHTGSAAAEFAGAVKAFGLATIVGEETGGQPNSFGNPFPFTLPRSKLTVQIATARGVRASGDLNDFTSVKPDIVMRATAEDIRAAGFDPVLERAKSCPERGIR